MSVKEAGKFSVLKGTRKHYSVAFISQKRAWERKEKKHCVFVCVWVCVGMCFKKTPTHIKTSLSWFICFCASIIAQLCKSNQPHLMSAFFPMEVHLVFGLPPKSWLCQCYILNIFGPCPARYWFASPKAAAGESGGSGERGGWEKETAEITLH